MTHEQFIMWLHGFLEISEAKTLNEKQLQIIKDHLEVFFTKVTPDRSVEGPIIQELSKCNCGDYSSTSNWCPVHGQKMIVVTPLTIPTNPFPPYEIIC